MCDSSENALPANDQGYINQVIAKRVASTYNGKHGWDIHFKSGYIGFLPYEDAIFLPEPNMVAQIYAPVGGICDRKMRGLWINGTKFFYEPLPAEPVVMEFTPEELAVIYMVTGKITGHIYNSARKFTDDVYRKICKFRPYLHNINQSGATSDNKVDFHFTEDSLQIVRNIAKEFN